MKVAIILPSRGLVFSQTAQEILDTIKDFKAFGGQTKIFFSHRKPLPDCFEEPTNRALLDYTVTHLWFVEDDMVIGKTTLRDLVREDVNAVTCDYPVTRDGRGSVFYDQSGRVVFCGTGCLLVKREVFDSLQAPYFTDSIRWTMLNYGEAIKMVASKNQKGEGYGLHDITFCIKLWKAGVIIQVLPEKLAQRKLIALGKAGTNHGAHKIAIWKKIVKDARLKAIQKQPVALGAKSKLVTVDTPTGGINTTRKHADNLVAQGLATYPPRRFTIIDDSEVDI